jgi:hypothetical protein
LRTQNNNKYCNYSAALLLLTLTTHVSATNLNISYGQQEYQVNFQDETVTLNPNGKGAFFGTNLTDDLSLNLDYQTWQGDKNINNRFNTDMKLDTLGASLNYYLDEWSFSLNYSQYDIDTAVYDLKKAAQTRNENTESFSVGGSLGYGFSSGTWFYGVLVSGLYSEWDFDKSQIKGKIKSNKAPKILTEKSSGDSTSISSSLSAAHYWSLSENTGVMLGALLSWNYLISGDSVLISRNGRNINTGANQRNTSRGTGARATNATALNSISGDDSYGQLAVYISYDISSSWSVDLDSSVNFESDSDAFTSSVTLGYVF